MDKPIRLNLQLFAELSEEEQESALLDWFEEEPSATIDDDTADDLEGEGEEEGEYHADDEEADGTEDMTQEELEAFLEVQYNKEKKKLSKEETIEYAQKGMNYDKIHSQLEKERQAREELENDKLRKWAYDYMKENNFEDPDSFLRAVDIEKRRRELMQRGMTPDEAKREAERDREVDELKKRIEKSETRTKRQQEMADFLSWYGGMKEKGVFEADFDATNIPQDVLAKVQDGMGLKEAYMEHALVALKQNAEQEVVKKLAKKKKASPGSVNDDVHVEESGDDKWSIKYIEQMTKKHGRDWVRANYDKIEKSGYYDQ